MGKLDGIKVIDLSVFLPGPMMTLMMADQGAQVIKIEPPSGDPARAMEPIEAGQSVWFRNLNRGKASLALDLKTDSGRDRLWDLIDDADVFVEGFRPGAMKRLGFDYEAVAARNPRIVYCSISAFGQSGPMAHHPGHDMVVQALSGFLSVNDVPGARPAVPGVPSADMAAGLTALSAVLMAIIGREKSGRGDYVDCAMFDSLLPWCAHIAGEAIAGGDPPVSASQRSLGGAAFYQVYATKDGRLVALGGREPKFVANLLNALGRPDLIPLGEAPAGEAQALLRDYLAEQFAARTRDEWIAWFADKDVAFAPVLDFREALSQPHVADRGLLVDADGAHQIAPAIRFAHSDQWTPRAAPALGQDN
ncbi:CoA transferase [Altererythrobacter marinus]|uniref:CoA transferase n=1 Tax=Pelagerythrobacter marinus TaxID=538382 RepID=A0ABW9UZU4_9SPHN|nr:CoA transferase [Pelagerythrobacter marinus]MXO69471.1 CoA transferase [Pelagerythrobacter marinus]